MYLTLERINKYFGEGENRIQVLRNVSCSLERGELCVLLGPSGSGKSTLLNIIGGIEQADSGTVSIDGDPILGQKEQALSRYRRRHLGYVFQTYNLIQNLTVRENIEVGAYLVDDPLDVDELIRELGLWDHRHKIPHQLSGGQQQRTAIGRAVVKRPEVLLCDEPTGALDYHTSKEILQLIEDLNQKYASTVVLVTHNDALQHMADRVIKLKDGRILSDESVAHRVPAADLEW